MLVIATLAGNDVTFGLSGYNSVTKTGAELMAAGATVPFTESYAISVSTPSIASGGTHAFTGATVGYASITPVDFTISNIGTLAMTNLSVVLTTGTNFTLSTAGLDATLVPGGTTSFTIKPNDGLAVGTYTDTVTITDTNLPASYTFNISFTVGLPIFTQAPTVITDMSKDAVFVISGNFVDLAGVSINGHALTLTPTLGGTKILLSGYPGYNGTLGDAVEGSVILTFYKEFLATLPDGTYTLRVTFSDGVNVVYATPETTFTISRYVSGNVKVPPTGDGMNLTGWWLALFLSAIGASLIYRMRKRGQVKGLL